MRHIGVLFTKNVFGDDSVKVTAKTVIAKTDTGEWTHLEEFKAYIKTSKDKQQAIVTHQTYGNA
ncbi:hypothetical protein [Paucihalobacter sp.]|uniref:hypothetical protein n=1 Tax=Paucihalobacter sp. TaxID=2850405 RepID=UPI003D160C3F